MFVRFAVAAAVGAAFVAPVAAIGADDTQVQQIRNELETLRQDYETRIRQLEQRLDEAGQAAAGPSAAPPAAVAPASANAFNPAISLILGGHLSNLQRDPDSYRLGGFIPGGEEIGPGPRGFSLGESELNVSANIDPYFSGWFVLAVSPENEASVEEAYVQNTGAVDGLTVKFGRFLSGFGYLNEVHAHAWEFVDLPLVHQAFFGGQLQEDGVQARWLAPTPLFVELGVETGRGAGFPGSERNKNGANAAMVFAHLGDDLGLSSSYRVGASYRITRAQDRAYADDDVAGVPTTNAVSADSTMWGVDLVWKWSPNGNPVQRNFKFQAEYLHRLEDGSLAFDTPGINLAGPYRASQAGWYMQGAYQFLPRWRVGLRYDELHSGHADIGLVDSGARPAADFPGLAQHKPRRATAMLDFSPSEFSRLRLQYARDEARFDAADNQLFLQYVISLGSHGAHKF